jgi:hypothetical protein
MAPCVDFDSIFKTFAPLSDAPIPFGEFIIATLPLSDAPARFGEFIIPLSDEPPRFGESTAVKPEDDGDAIGAEGRSGKGASSLTTTILGSRNLIGPFTGVVVAVKAPPFLSL